jgi:magnesium chelatase family protein
MQNAAMINEQLDKHVHLDDSQKEWLLEALEKLKLSARSYHRLLRVARTIADLAGETQVRQRHLAEALNYRLR